MPSAPQIYGDIPVTKVPFLLQTDVAFCLKFFLGDKLEYEVGDFQKEVMPLLWKAEENVALALPRGYTKTTMAKIATVLRLTFTRSRFGLYIRESMNDAKLAAEDVINFFKTDRWAAVFGAPIFITENKSDGIWKLRLPHNNKLIILKAGSYKSGTRGLNVENDRPDFAIVDDLDQREDSSDVRNTKDIWFHSTFMEALKVDSVVVYLGNLTSEHGILNDLLEDPDWSSYHYGVLKEDGTPLWAALRSLERIKKDFDKFLRKRKLFLWFQEMMNIPIPEGSVIREGDIKYVSLPAPTPGVNYQWLSFLVVDLAISKKDRADEAAIVEYVWVPYDENDLIEISCSKTAVWTVDMLTPEKGIWVKAQHFNKPGQSVFQLFKEIRKIATVRNTNAIFVESVAYQAAALEFYPYLALQENWTSAKWFKVEPRNRKKSERISKWSGLLIDQVFGVLSGDWVFTQKLLKYDPNDKTQKKDLLDASSYGADVVNEFKLKLVQTFEQSKIKTNNAEYQRDTVGQSLVDLLLKSGYGS